MGEKNNNKAYIIIIMVLLFIIGLGAGYIYGSSTKQETLKSQEKEEKKESEPIEERKKDNNPNEEKEEIPNDNSISSDSSIIIETLESKGEKVSKEITINNKTNTLVLESNNNKQKDGILTFGGTKLCFITGWGTGPSYDCAPEKVEYSVIKGEDDKEYLFIYYQSNFDKYILIINDSAKIIGKYSSRVSFEHYDCFATLENSEEPIYITKNNSIYYYKSESPIEDTNKPISLSLVKLIISNNKVSEEKTNENRTGQYVQCT